MSTVVSIETKIDRYFEHAQSLTYFLAYLTFASFQTMAFVMVLHGVVTS